MNEKAIGSASNPVKKTLLYIHSEGQNRSLVEQMYQYDFAFTHCRFETCEKEALASRPDIIIFEMDGFVSQSLRACQQIRQQFDHDQTGIIFLSSDSSNAIRFECYDAGGDDFIGKPFDLKELSQKIDVLWRSIKADRKIEKNQEYAFKLIKTSLSAVGEQGVVIHFFQDSISLVDYAALAERLFTALGSLELSASLAIWPDSQTLFYSNKGGLQLIERKLLEVSHETKAAKINTLGHRCLFQGKLVSLLIHNMPTDEEKAGRYRDILAMLIDGMDILTNQVDLKSRLMRSEMQLTQTMLLTSQSVEALKTRTTHSRGRIKQANDNLIANMEAAVMSLGLTEEQEHELIKLVETTEHEIDKEIAESLVQEEEMGKILEQSRDIKWNNSI